METTTRNEKTRHEMVISNPDVDVRFYLSKDEGSYVTPHWHDSLELVYVIKGCVTLNLPHGISQTAHSNEFILANPREIHSVLSEKNEALVLQIPQKFYEKFLSPQSLYHFAVNMHPENTIEQTKLEKIKKTFLDLFITYDIRPEGYQLRFYSLLYDLLFTLVHSYSQKIQPSEYTHQTKMFHRMKDIMDYIDKNHRNAISTSTIANHFSYHPDYLARFFKKYMNCTITDYIYAIRIHYVEQDLIQTQLPIAQIFEVHGCSNHHLAMKYFKQQWGCTPSQYRKNIR